MKHNISYCLTGGHVELGEDSQTAILREMLEEIDAPVSISNELAIVENFYLDKDNLQTPEISFYYIVNPENFDNILLPKYEKEVKDKGKLKIHNFEWLNLSLLKDYDFKPKFIKEKLISKNYNFEHIIVK